MAKKKQITRSKKSKLGWFPKNASGSLRLAEKVGQVAGAVVHAVRGAANGVGSVLGLGATARAQTVSRTKAPAKRRTSKKS